MTDNFKYFPRILSEVVDQVKLQISTRYAPVYEYGNYFELMEACQIKDINQIQKYPLIWLVWDHTENTGKWIDPYIYQCSPRVFIATLTDKDWTSKQRYSGTFEPVLSPLFDLLIEEMNYHEAIGTLKEMAYQVNDHPFWLNNTEGSFDILSAIEIKFENLLIYKK